ncbi:hypothetical protein HPB49_026073 [Dermacentor silvarum]|nr:hypothetical protein HPB49_026073 [Dermacentor silvarum]
MSADARTPMTMASSEWKRQDKRGAVPRHVLYMAMKVMGHRVASSMTTMFRNNKLSSTNRTPSLPSLHPRWTWNGLLKLLQQLRVEPSEVVPDIETLTVTERTERVSDDPVVCAAYFDHKVRVMSILSNKQISSFGRYYVVDYIKRIEFQHRGSAHAHILL